MDVILNNFVNISMNGFKVLCVVFEDLLYQIICQFGVNLIQQIELLLGLQFGIGVQQVVIECLYMQGGFMQIGNLKDVVINGVGFFQVLMLDGINVYMCDGLFQINVQGQFVMLSGYQVLLVIIVLQNVQLLMIGKDGVVLVMQLGLSNVVQIGLLQIVIFINLVGFEVKGENLFVEMMLLGVLNVLQLGLNGVGVFNQGYVEVLNVNVVQEFVNMIQMQCVYEINSKVVMMFDQMLQIVMQMKS